MIPFVKKNAYSQAYKYFDTEYGLTILPSLSSMKSPQIKIDHLSNKIKDIRDDVINSAKKVYDNEVINRINKSLYSQQQSDLIDPRLVAIISQGNSCNIFNYFSEHFGTDYVQFVTVTAPFFLSPIILHKGWITKLKAFIEAKYRFTIAKIESYDTP